jgi:hypothetical protein
VFKNLILVTEGVTTVNGQEKLVIGGAKEGADRATTFRVGPVVVR